MSAIRRICCAAVAAFLLGMFTNPTLAQTDIRETPGGKRLLFVDGDDIRPEPGGKRLLFVDGDSLRPEPGGKRLLFLDGDNVRPDPQGIRIAFLDGKEIRRRPGGEVLLHVLHPDIRNRFGGERLLFIDGKELTKAQLVAVLYVLRPAMFKLTEKEEADLKAEMAANAKAEEERLKADNIPGKYSIAAFSSSDKKERKGTVNAVKHGSYYKLRFQFDGEVWDGAAARVGKEELWAAIGPEHTAALAMFDVTADGGLTGTWVPAYLLGTENPAFGSETLTAVDKKGTDFKIKSAKLPKTGDTYEGTLKASPVQAQLNGEGITASMVWTLGQNKVYGVGLRSGNKVGVAAAAAKEFAIVRFKVDSTGLIGDFLTNTGAKGFYTLLKD